MLAKLIDIDRFIHSLKTAIACILGLLLTKIIGFQGDQWIVITIIVVMCAQIYVGSVMQRAYLRFLGTLIGCLFAATAILAAGHVTLTVAATTIALSSFVFSYISTSQENLSYAGTLGAVTTAIILISQQPTIDAALLRFIEISIGILIAAFVSQFVLPIHARTHLRRAQAATLEKLRDYYTACMVDRPAQDESAQWDFDESIVKLLSKQRLLAKEAVREPLGVFYDPKLFMQSLHCEREILWAINFMHIALTRLQTDETLVLRSPILQDINKTVVDLLNTLITTIESDEPPKEHVHLPIVVINTLKEDIKKNLPLPSPEKLMYLNTFLFSVETLINSLTELLNLYHVPIYHPTLTKPSNT